MKGFTVLALILMTQGIFVSGRQCIPGTTWMEDCNHCACSDDGFRLCTAMACSPSNVVFDFDFEWEYKYDLSCTPGSEFNNKCNRCVCGADGKHALCTLMAC